MDDHQKWGTQARHRRALKAIATVIYLIGWSGIQNFITVRFADVGNTVVY